jgi:DNA replication licensing factor MCM5
MFEGAAKDALKQFLLKQSEEAVTKTIPDFQIIFQSAQLPQSLRNLTAEHVNKLVKVPGIVISCTNTRARATNIVVRCTKCGDMLTLPCKSAFGGVNIPAKCEGVNNKDKISDPCPPSPFVIMADQCEYIDQQTLKMQESPEVVPTGEMPRNILLSVDRYSTDSLAATNDIDILTVLTNVNIFIIDI